MLVHLLYNVVVKGIILFTVSSDDQTNRDMHVFSVCGKRGWLFFNRNKWDAVLQMKWQFNIRTVNVLESIHTQLGRRAPEGVSVCVLTSVLLAPSATGGWATRSRRVAWQQVSVASTLVSGVRRKDCTELISRLIPTCSSVTKISCSHWPLLTSRSLGESCQFSCELVASIFKVGNEFLLRYVSRHTEVSHNWTVPTAIEICLPSSTLKCKVHPRTGHEVPEGE